jgi:NTE family protein
MVNKAVLSCLLITCYSIASGQQYKYLALKGGGVRGIAYTGAVKVLEEKGVMQGIEKVAGTSAGAIAGLLLSLGYTAEQMERIMFDLNIETLNDGESSIIGGQRRMRRTFGWYKGEEFEHWLGDLVSKQTGDNDLTFKELHDLSQKNKQFKDLYVTATNLSQQRLEIFSWETYPDMQVNVAVRASMSIPLYYSAMFIDSTGRRIKKPTANDKYSVYVDGGLIAIYPIDVFNTERDNATNTINEHTLGLKLDRPEQIDRQQQTGGIAPYNIRSFNSYIGALYNLTLEQLNRRIPYEEEKKHTIYISTSNMHPRVRHISDKQKKRLFENGENAARAFFEKKR